MSSGVVKKLRSMITISVNGSNLTFTSLPSMQFTPVSFPLLKLPFNLVIFQEKVKERTTAKALANQ
jgi:hypothetical protein